MSQVNRPARLSEPSPSSIIIENVHGHFRDGVSPRPILFPDTGPWLIVRKFERNTIVVHDEFREDGELDGEDMKGKYC